MQKNEIFDKIKRKLKLKVKCNNQKCDLVFDIFLIQIFALLVASTMAGWAVGRIVIAISIAPLVVHTAQTFTNLFCWCCAGTSIANAM